MTTVRIELPPKLVPVFNGKASYRGAYGGRGSGKTRTFALMSAIWGYRLSKAGKRGLIVGVREFMNSLDDSSMAEIKEAIKSQPWLDAHYDIGEKYIRTKDGRISFAFVGLSRNIDSIKSKARIHLLWADEAEPISEEAWAKLGPTVREHDSEIWVTWNPENDTSATHKRFRETPPNDAKIVELNYRDNPWFPDVLEKRRLEDQEYRPEAYDWVWEGKFKLITDAQIFADKYRIADFEVSKNWDGPYQGGDFGFSQDPTAAIRCYISGDVLYISHEAYKTQLELDDTATFVNGKIPEFERYVTRWDNARPESISYLKRHGLPRSEAVTKWKGSVEDGVQFLRSFREIVIHPRCTNLTREFRLYSYKVDKKSEDILPIIVDAFNHGIDALRYAVNPMIKGPRQKSKPLFGTYGRVSNG